VTWRSSVTIVAKGEAAPGKGKRGDDISWADANLTGPKNRKNS
jgi:hypothetical protein